MVTIRRRSRLKTSIQIELIKYFCAGSTARSAAELTGINRNTHEVDFKQRGHFSANTMCQLFLDIFKSCGFKDALSHSGRRTYITRLANKGVGARLLAALAGHSHISTTQRYIDVNRSEKV